MEREKEDGSQTHLLQENVQLRMRVWINGHLKKREENVVKNVLE